MERNSHEVPKLGGGGGNKEEVVLVMDKYQRSNSSYDVDEHEHEFTLRDHFSTEDDHHFKSPLPSGNKPPLPPTSGTSSTTRMRSLRRLSFSKPKARMVEFNLPALLNNNNNTTITTNTTTTNNITNSTIQQEEEKLENQFDDKHSSMLYSSDDLDDEEEDEEDREGGDEDEETKWNRRKKRKKKLIQWKVMVEWVLFLTILTCFICSLTIKPLKNQLTWGLEIWKWCLMIMVVFSGRLVSGWVMSFLVFLIERNYMLKEKVLYFVYGLRRSFQNCVWLGLVLLAWTFMFNAKVHKKNKMLKKVFQFLVAILVGATIWLLKILLVKVLASSFHVRTYFDRMKESVFHHYILETLSGPPMDEILREEEHRHLMGSKSMPHTWKEAKNMYKSKRYGSRKIDMEKLKILSMQRTASAWSMKRLMNFIRNSGLSTISQTVDKFGKAEAEITSEWEARVTAKKIFKNVAKTSNAKYIEEEDLARFLNRVEIHTIFPLFEGALETGRITKSSFRNWVVRAYFERKALAHSLNDTKTAVQQLHKLASGIVCVIIFVVTLLVMRWATTDVIAVVMTQLVLLGFMFQNMCKTVFESIIFVFVMHPFDIGDRCVVDGVQMVVEEMNILTTVFLRYDMEKIYYPNSVLLTKPISNFYRSPEMCDGIDFFIDASTPVEIINAFKKSIQSYIESKPKHWNPKHSVIVKEIPDLNKMKMLLGVQHTINHQNYGERNVRISELILEMKRIFENLGIKYHLPPQEIHLTHFKNEY